MANLASITAALRRQGVSPELSSTPERIAEASMLVVPGVGAFGAAISELREKGLDRALLRRLSEARPTLAICLGMQILFEGSAESPGTRGLGFIPGQATTFPASVCSPQFGWNRIDVDPSCRILEPGACYFANSFKLDRAPAGWAAARACHGEDFIAALEAPGLLACQFHPELSGSLGRGILERWLSTSKEAVRPC
ncbi:MAG: imidazole glycerol phosphate synthase subunit HisH [Planctomycetota bacterium]